MKVVIRDKRAVPRVVYIDGKRYVFPSNKDVIKEISRVAFNNLSAMGCLDIKEYIEQPDQKVIEDTENQKDVLKEENVSLNNPKISSEDIDVSGLVVDDKLEDSQIISPVNNEEEVSGDLNNSGSIQESLLEELDKEQNSSESPLEESQNNESVSLNNEVDYSSLTKKELKALVEEKGGDPSGMSKTNLIDWLSQHLD